VGRLPFHTDVWLALLIAAQPLESSIDLGSGTNITITKLLGAICMVSFALDWFATRRQVGVDVTHAILFVLLAIGLISTLQAGSVPTSLATMTRYAGFVALYAILTQFIGDDRAIVRFAWGLTIGCAIASILAVRNFATGITLLARPLYGDPNDLGYMLATTLPFTLWLIRFPGWRRALAICAAAVILPTLALTFSRGAWLAIVAGFLWLVLRERRYVRVVLTAVLIGIVPLLGFVASHRQELTTGLTVKSHAAAENVSHRLAFYRAAVGLANEHPWLGVGPGNFPLYVNEAGGGPSEAATFVVHDAYLEVAAELGLPALVLFLAYIVIAFSRALAVRRADGLDVILRVALVIAIVGALPLSEEFYAPLWVLGAFASILSASSPTAEVWR
jgi:putative inorganic carbon (hco3(-)) transporter